jgi:hypothetical protein
MPGRTNTFSTSRSVTDYYRLFLRRANRARRSRRGVRTLKRPWGILKRSVWPAIGIVAAMYIYVETSRPVMIIDSFAVPKEYQDNGFTPEVVVNRVIDAIERMKAEAWREDGDRQRVNESTFTLAADQVGGLDFEVPATKVTATWRVAACLRRSRAGGKTGLQLSALDGLVYTSSCAGNPNENPCRTLTNGGTVYTRRELGKLALAGIPGCGLLLKSKALLGGTSPKPNSKWAGVEVGMNVPYSFGTRTNDDRGRRA